MTETVQFFGKDVEVRTVAHADGTCLASVTGHIKVGFFTEGQTVEEAVADLKAKLPEFEANLRKRVGINP